MKNYKNEPLAIFAGGGKLPKILIDECLKRGQEFQVFLLKEQKYEIDYSSFKPVKLAYGEVEKFIDKIKSKNLKNLVFVGSVKRPNFSSLKMDKKAAMLVAKILAKKILGDDAVLKSVVKFFEREGLNIVRIDELLDGIISKKQVLTKSQPNDEALKDIELGKKAIRKLSKFDIGQSLVLSNRQIIAVEALEGTDEMIKRCKNLNLESSQGAILVKMKKRFQTKKIDLPTIGIETIENCAKSKIKGIAIEAGGVLILEREKLVKRADKLGLFLTVI